MTNITEILTILIIALIGVCIGALLLFEAWLRRNKTLALSGAGMILVSFIIVHGMRTYLQQLGY